MSVYYFLGRYENSQKKGFVFQTIALLVVLGGLLSTLLYLFSGFIASTFNNPALLDLLNIFCLYPLFTVPLLCAETILISFDLPKKAAGITFLIRGTMVIASIIPVVLGYDLRNVFKVLVILSAFQFFYVVIEVWKPVRFYKFEWRLSMLLSQIKYSVPLGVSYVFQMLMMQIDKIMVSIFFVASTFAVYVNGAFEIPFVGIVTGSVIHVLMPEFVKYFKDGDTESLLRLWHQSMQKVALIMFPMATALFVFREQFIVTLFSEKYVQSIIIFSIYLVFIPIRITDYGAILLSMGFSAIVLKIYFLASISNILINYLFIKMFGFIGPALSTVLISYLVAISFIVQIKNKIGVNFINVFPWRNLSKLMTIALMSGLIIYPISLISPQSVFILILGGVGFLAVYIVLLKLFGLINEADILLVRRWLRVLHISV